MNRREFIVLIGGAAACPIAAHAQQPATPVIGFLHLPSERGMEPYIKAFRSGLAALGYTEGKNIRVLFRYADEDANRLPALAVELVSHGAMVIVTTGTTAIRAAHDAVPNVPIVSWGAPDPVMQEWAPTLARSPGMITGVFSPGGTNVKRLELLKEVRPQATTFGLLMNVTNPGNPIYRSVARDAARTLGITVEIVEVGEPSKFADAFDRMASQGVEGVVITGDPVFASNAAAIAKLARLHRLASAGDGRFFVDAGGLFAYSTNYVAMVRRSAWYVDQILKGISPRDLPAEQATEFKLIVNLKTANELGITIPPSVLARSDEVIE
jgi:putative ABC transport system substrate-binding protein